MALLTCVSRSFFTTVKKNLFIYTNSFLKHYITLIFHLGLFWQPRLGSISDKWEIWRTWKSFIQWIRRLAADDLVLHLLENHSWFCILKHFCNLVKSDAQTNKQTNRQTDEETETETRRQTKSRTHNQWVKWLYGVMCIAIHTFTKVTHCTDQSSSKRLIKVNDGLVF